MTAKPDKAFKAHHISATAEHLAGNGGVGRYLFLPGSDGRAKEISERFRNMEVVPHSRAHNLYTGTIDVDGKAIDVGAISTGMGCPSIDIIFTELVHLGARRFLRVGTAGTLQPGFVNIGDLLVATASVRDEGTTTRYLPAEVPALASLESVTAARSALQKADSSAGTVHFGPVHCKDSLFAREFGAGPQRAENERYMDIIRQAGVLASEMETAALFVLSMLFNHQFRKEGRSGPSASIVSGALLSIVGDESAFGTPEQFARTTERAIDFGFGVIGEMARQDDLLRG